MGMPSRVLYTKSPRTSAFGRRRTPGLAVPGTRGRLRVLLMALAGLIRGAGLVLHQIDVEPVDPHSLIGQPVAQGG